MYYPLLLVATKVLFPVKTSECLANSKFWLCCMFALRHNLCMRHALTAGCLLYTVAAFHCARHRQPGAAFGRGEASGIWSSTPAACERGWKEMETWRTGLWGADEISRQRRTSSSIIAAAKHVHNSASRLQTTVLYNSYCFYDACY